MVDKKVTEDSVDYIIDIQHVQNRDIIMQLFENSNFNQLLQNKCIGVTLKPELDLVKRQVPKKKKTAMPYIINSFIFYTSFLSKADLKLKKKSWQMMGAVDAITKKPVDGDGYEFRKLIENLELFHKKLVVYDDVPDNTVINYDKTSDLRKKVIGYSQLLLTSCYKNIEVGDPERTDDDEEFYMACAELYKHYGNFKNRVDQFKKFVVRHDLNVRGDEEEKTPKKRSSSSSTTTSKAKRTNEMVSDMIDEQ